MSMFVLFFTARNLHVENLQDSIEISDCTIEISNMWSKAGFRDGWKHNNCDHMTQYIKFCNLVQWIGRVYFNSEDTLSIHGITIEPITRRQNFRQVLVETNCRRHFKVNLKWKIGAIQCRKHCEKRRNCLLQAISPFSHNVFHSYISLVRQDAALCGNGLISSIT